MITEDTASLMVHFVAALPSLVNIRTSRLHRSLLDRGEFPTIAESSVEGTGTVHSSGMNETITVDEESIGKARADNIQATPFLRKHRNHQLPHRNVLTLRTQAHRTDRPPTPRIPTSLQGLPYRRLARSVEADQRLQYRRLLHLSRRA